MVKGHAFNVLGPPRAAKAPTCTPSTFDCAAEGDQKKRSARLLLPYLPPPITCSRMAHSIMISAPPTSIAVVPKPKHAASSSVWLSLAFLSTSSLCQLPHDRSFSL